MYVAHVVRFRVLSCGLLLLVVLVFAPRANAFERQWHAGVDAGYAGISWDGAFRSGFGGGVHGAYGLTDAFNLMLEVGGSMHSVCEGCSSLSVLHGGAGVGYTLDILRWVPYMGLLVGGYRFGGVTMPEARQDAQFKVGLQGALGMDFRPSRSWAVGVQLRYHTMLDDPLEVHYMTMFGRFELLWGW